MEKRGEGTKNYDAKQNMENAKEGGGGRKTSLIESYSMSEAFYRLFHLNLTASTKAHSVVLILQRGTCGSKKYSNLSNVT